MNQTLLELKARKSVRVFENRAVEPETRRQILEAAAEAPTAGNQQMYTILEITDPELRAAFGESCDHQRFIATAPMLLVFCADVQKWVDTYEEGGAEPRKPGAGDFVLAVCDAMIAAQNAVTAAQSLGVGSCYIADVMENCELHRKLLNLPEYVFPAAMLVFGYPTQQQREREKPARCRMEDIVQQNAYHRRDGAALRAMFAEKAGAKSFEEWCTALCKRRYNVGFQEEMNRSLEEYLKAYRP